MQMRAETAEQWLALSGKNLKDIMAAIDKDLKPQSFVFPTNLSVEVDGGRPAGCEAGAECVRVPARRDGRVS